MNDRVHPVRLFCSYSQRDEDLRREFEKHMTLLKREGLLSTWTFRDIKAGADWDRAIHRELEVAEIIVLLISADFVASDYCWNVEMTRAMERDLEQSAIVVPVIIRACQWQAASFARLQALPTDAIPVLNWPSQDAAWTNVAEGLRHRIVEFSGVCASEPSAVRLAKRIARRKTPIAITDADKRRMTLTAYSAVITAVRSLVDQITAVPDSVPIKAHATVNGLVVVTVADIYVFVCATGDLAGESFIDLLLTNDIDVTSLRSPQRRMSFRLDISEHMEPQWLSEDGIVLTANDMANEAILMLLDAYDYNGPRVAG